MQLNQLVQASVKISRGEAAAGGLFKYFTGKPCKNEHVANRYVCDGCCVVCSAVSRKGARARNPKKYCDRETAWRRDNRHRPEIWVNTKVGEIRRRCKKNGAICNITGQDILACIPSDHRCPVLGIPLIFGSGGQFAGNPSVDCMTPALSYVKGNIRIISHRANQLKSDVTDPDELQKVVDDIRKIHDLQLHKRAP
jgi:hypothetical protein